MTSPPMHVEPVTLQGTVIRLEPLTIEHVPALTLVGREPAIWHWNLVSITTEDEMRSYVATALDERARGVSLPFVIVDQRIGNVIGCTRYANIEPAHRRLEIGWTWYTPAYQRTAANTEAKLLLLTHAFETLGANRVELKTDSLNEQSRNAIIRIGATQEGIFRNHMVVEPSGRLRHTVYYSIIKSEWPAIQRRLTERLARR